MAIHQKIALKVSSRSRLARRFGSIKCLLVTCAATLLPVVDGVAAIAPGSTGNGELFLSVADATARVSYTFDLGVRMDDFFVAAQQDGGYQRFWAIDDADWATFLATSSVSVSRLRWAVLASDTVGNTSPGGQRLFTTMTAGISAAVINSPTNTQFSAGNSAAQLSVFILNVNLTGTHSIRGDVPSQNDYTTNGSSVNAESDTGRTFFGEAGGTGPSLNGNFVNLRLDNPVGSSSWFYYLTRSSNSVGVQPVLVDEFDNQFADGYFGLIYVDPALYATSPYVGKYLLSYTITPYALPRQVAFAASIGRTEFDGSYSVARLDGMAAAGAETSAASSITRLPGFAIDAVSAVPEPASAALMGIGLLALLGLARRRPAA